MRAPLTWLQEFAPLPDDPERIAVEFNDLGLEVEGVERPAAALGGVVVAEVLETRPHPDADRIQLVDVDPGDGEALQICCGAFNMTPGDRVPLATVGTVMADGRDIQRRKLRGEWSNGMLCSAVELGLGDDAEGIMILAPDLTAGVPVADALGLADETVFDLEVNPNRPDALSMAGLARDLAARFGLPFSLPEPPEVPIGGVVADRARVEIVHPDACGRFVARVLDDVTIGPSPDWLARRVQQAGMRPISNVVDVSNFVMLELGYPNHAYDLDRVAGGALRVRWATEGEELVTLDDVTRSLTGTDVVICDGDDAPIGLAGVMGGASTEIADTTTSVLIEAAWWHPMHIARTSTRLGLRSEASIRFERGADIWGIDRAIERFCSLLVESGATVVDGRLDERGAVPETATIRVRTDRVNRVLGTELEPGQIAAYLGPIGFGVEADGPDHEVEVPSFRPDVTAEIDVIEEVARHHGYRNIPRTVPTLTTTGRLNTRQHDRRTIRGTLVGLGLDEALPLPFLAPDDLDRSGLTGSGIAVANPLVDAESLLRPSLRPGLLRTVAYNQRHRIDRFGLFEIGRVFLDSGDKLPDEPEHLAVVLVGEEAPSAVEVWQALAEALGVGDVELVNEGGDGLHATRRAELRRAGAAVGCLGEIDPGVLDAWEIAGRVAWLEVDLDALLTGEREAAQFAPVSRYPSNDIDLAFVVADDVPAAAVEATIAQAAGDLLADLDLFDVFRGAGVDDGSRSLAYALRLQAADRTLTDDEVAEVRRAVIDAVATGHEAHLRG